MRISDWSSDVCSSDLNGDAGTGARADDKLTDDLNDILQPFHWEAWKAALFSDHPDGWPDDDEQDAICQRVDSMAVGEHYQAWSEEVQEKIVSLFRSEEHTSELQSLMRHSYAGFGLKKKKRVTREEYNNINE